MSELDIPENTTKQKSQKRDEVNLTKSKKSSSMGWFLGVLGIGTIVIASVVFAKPECFHSFDEFKQCFLKQEPSKPDYYGQFLGHLSWDKAGNVDELKKFIDESEIEQVANDLAQDVGNNNKLYISLIFVPRQFPTGGNAHIYIDNFSEFDENSFDDIVEKQQVLRDIFAAFQKVDAFKEICQLDSIEYPTLAFSCQVASLSYEADNITESSEFSPFFNLVDAKKAQFLQKITAEVADKVLNIRVGAKTLDILCTLNQKQARIKAGIDYELDEIGNDEFKTITESVMQFIQSLEKQCKQ